jgi:hypothetical protein
VTNRLSMTNRVLISAAITAVLLGVVALLAAFLMGNLGSGVPNAPITAQNPLAGTSSTATAQDPPVSDEYVTIRTQDFGVWSYSATRSDIDPLHASVNYKHDSVADLKAYVEANRALLPQVVKLGGLAEVTVSFVYPVGVEWFRNWAKQNEFRADSSQLAMGRPGFGATVSISGTADDPLPQDKLGTGYALDGSSSGDGGVVFGTYGDIDAARLPKLLSEPKVFLVDVTPTWVRHDLTQAGVQEQLHDRVQVALPFGWMVRLGLQNFTDLSIPTPLTTVEPIILSPAPDEP